MAAPYLALPGRFPRSLLPRLESWLQRVPLRPFRSSIAPTEFLVGPGVVARLTPAYQKEDDVDVWIGALHRSALSPLADLDITWRRFDG